MSKINKLNTLAETKFLSLYNAEYNNKGGNTKNWIIASRKEKKNLEEVYLNNKELQDDGTLAQISTKWFDADITIKE